MKLAKKITSIASAAAMFASFAALNVDAIDMNQYGVSYDVLTNDIEISDGTIVPAGAVAVTVTVSGNTGFNANTFKLTIDEDYSVVTNSDCLPAVSANANFSNVLFGSALYDNTLCITAASSDLCHANGDMLTFYITGNNGTGSDLVDLFEVEPELAITPMSGSIGFGEGASINEHYKKRGIYLDVYYYSGDADNDDDVDAVDASLILSVVNSVPGNELNVATYNYTSYFPSVIAAGQPDANQMGTINATDAQLVLNHAANIGLNPNYVDPYCAFEVFAYSYTLS